MMKQQIEDLKEQIKIAESTIQTRDDQLKEMERLEDVNLKKKDDLIE